MRTIVRETLSRRLDALPSLVARYQKRDPAYVTAVLAWLSETEEELGRLRSPLAGFVAARRSTLLAARDGLRLESVTDANKRRAERATASLVLAEIEGELRAVVQDAEEFLGEMADKMAQLLAVAPGETFDGAVEGAAREAWLRELWKRLRNGNGGAGMHGFLSARMAAVDRLYVLDDLVRNLSDGGAPPA